MGSLSPFRSMASFLQSFSSVFFWRSDGRREPRTGSGNGSTKVDKLVEEFQRVSSTVQFAYSALWLVWLITGMLFYKYWLELTWARAFYMAVNVGYSVGWGDIHEDNTSQLFSCFYVLCGASFVAAALSFFAGSIVRDRKNWYTNAVRKAEYENYLIENAGNFLLCFRAWTLYHYLAVRAISLWIAFIIAATIAGYVIVEEFEGVNALYFAITTASTGGLLALPRHSEDWAYGLTGLYGALSVPIMGVAMATLASLFLTTDNIEDTMKAIRDPVGQTEVDMLTEFELADADGVLDKAEFIILCMVRTGSATPELIRTINDHFNALDRDKNGVLTLEELAQPLRSKSIERKEHYNMMIQKALQHHDDKRQTAKKRHTASSPSGGAGAVGSAKVVPFDVGAEGGESYSESDGNGSPGPLQAGFNFLQKLGGSNSSSSSSTGAAKRGSSAVLTVNAISGPIDVQNLSQKSFSTSQQPTDAETGRNADLGYCGDVEKGTTSG